mgnify:CR=1 FL=1
MESYMNVVAPSLAIHGEIQNTKSVSINGRDLFLNEKKTFSEIIDYIVAAGKSKTEKNCVAVFTVKIYNAAKMKKRQVKRQREEQMVYA